MASPDVDSLLQQLRSVSSLSTSAGVDTPKLPNFLAEYRKKHGVGSPVNIPGMGGGVGGNDEFKRFVNAISGQESGGNYGAVNSSSGAMGRYQIMPGNVSAWSRRILGKTLTRKQFLSSPALQDRIAQTMLRNYVKKYGYSGAAAAWYGGEGVAKNWKSKRNPEGSYPSIYNYVQQIMRRMKR